MSQDAKDWVIVQLKDYIAQLRALDPPSTDGAVASVIGDGSRVGLERFGPFRNHDVFFVLALRSTLSVHSRVRTKSSYLMGSGMQRNLHMEILPQGILW